MPLPEPIRRTAEAEVEAFCERRVPSPARDRIRLEHRVRGNSITIVERRPPWRTDLGPEWSRLPIAQLRYDERAREWTLWWQRANGRWEPYWDIGPVRDIRRLLREIDEDPTSLFWG